MAEQAIYISYSRDDGFIAAKLVNDLEKSGVTVWYDDNLLRAGSDWKITLDTAIENCSVLAWILTDSSIRSDFVAHEISLAQKLGKRIVPLMFMRGYAAEQIGQFGLSNIHIPSIRTLADYEKAVDDLVEIVKPDLQPITNALIERGLTPRFRSVFKGMLMHPNKAQPDSMLLHYSAHLSVEQLIEVETAINDILRETIIDYNDFSELAELQVNNQKIMVVDSHDHSGSTDVVIVLSSFAAAVLAEPELRAILIGLVTNLIYDLLKKSANTVLVAVRGTDEDVSDDVNMNIPEQKVSRLEESVTKITQKSRYFAIGSTRFTLGSEERTTETTYKIIM